MSSYRSSYIPWNSASNNTNKQNAKEKFQSANSNNRYPSSRSSTCSSTPSGISKSNNSGSTSTSTYQYRKPSSAILKKYANFTSPLIDKKLHKVDDGHIKDPPKSSIPKCKPFTKFVANDLTDNQGLRYTNSSKFGGPIARSPIKENLQPVFGVSTYQQEAIPAEVVILITRSTSPTPSHLLCAGIQSGQNDNDDFLLSEVPKRQLSRSIQSSSTQTSDDELRPCSRVAALSSRFLTSGSDCIINRFPSRVNNYNYTRPVESAIRSLPLRKSYLSPERLESETQKLSPSLQQLSPPSDHQRLRTLSPLMMLNKSLTNLNIEGDTDTEDESSYNEDYPLEKESYSLVVEKNLSSELPDKPPKYPLSPNLKHRTLSTILLSPSNERCCSNTSSSGQQDSSSEDINERIYNDKNIPISQHEISYKRDNFTPPNRSDKSEVDGGKKLYPLRKMDSEDQPWWMNSNSSESCPNSDAGHDCQINSVKFLHTDNEELSNTPVNKLNANQSDSESISWSWLHSNAGYAESINHSQSSKNNVSPAGYTIRKMDSFDIPWWCKSDENITSSGKSGNSGNSKKDLASSSAPTDEECKIGFTIRKMDSNEILWGCNSEKSVSPSLSQPQTDDTTDNSHLQPLHSIGDNFSTHKLRKFDSSDGDCWAEDERSKTGTPDWCQTNGNAVETIESYQRNQTIRIGKIEPIKLTSKIETLAQDGYRIQKIDSGEKPWWMDNSSDEKPPTINEESRLLAAHGPSADDKFSNSGNYKMRYIDELENLLLYIGKYTNIDDLLGTEVPPPAAPKTPSNDTSSDDDADLGFQKIAPSQVKIHDGSAYTSTIQRRNHQLDDAALQLYKDGDYSSYLDLDSSISEQQEEFEGFQPNRKDSIVVRTQLSVRVHLIIEKLMKSEGRELRRALFSLKQIFQEDKDLVHEFVQNDGLDCLIKVGSDVDQNYQNYILRALGQVMLYVDGMNGVMEHNPTIQWLYSLVSSKFRLVVKTALKLLLVFVEYVESNCLLLIQAIHMLNNSQGTPPWSNLMKLLHEYDVTDTELLIYAMTLINKTLNGIPDQDTYYDEVDLLEEQDIESVIRKYMSKQGTDLDLLRQFQIYEAVLQHEDGEDRGTPLKQLDETIRKTLRNRKLLTNGTANNDERRKSRRHSTGTTALSHAVSLTLARHHSETSSAEDYRIKQTTESAGVTPGLRRRRERAERQRSLLREQYECNMRALMDSTSSSEDGLKNGPPNGVPHIYVNNTVNKLETMDDSTVTSRSYCNGDASSTLKREATVRDITQKLATLQTPDEITVAKSPSQGRVEEMKGIISKAMEGLAKSQSRCDMLKSPTSETTPSAIMRPAETKKSETDLHWEELLATSTRALKLCDLDFSDLRSDDDNDVLAPTCSVNGIPPPPPPCGAPPPVPCVPKTVANKGKKTVKLFWKEVREDPIVMTKLNSKQLIWDEMFPVILDTQRLEHLFESRAKDLITKKQHELNKNKEIIVLDPKRSNAINIGMTKLPPPRSIKTAILKMDSTVMNREGIEKLLMMLPTEEERSKIQEAQAANPDLPLGTAEHFLLTLASISELTARLKLWSFKLNYENIEKEIADPLMDLKQGMEVLRENKTFRAILSTLLSIGIFLNGAEVKGFQVEYLAKVPEVKDTVHKHSLLHHLCHIVMDKFPDSTDLYSEIGAITRASRVDFDELNHSIVRVEQECRASFDHLKAIAKHDGNTAVKLKISDFLADCAERIIALGKIHRRVLNRFYKFCLWLGVPLHRIQATKPNELCKVISEFALEYRTTRERVIQQLEKKASHRERNKTRGKMITDIGKFRSKEDKQDAELRQLLGRENGPENEVSNNNNLQCGSLPWRRLRKDNTKTMREQNLNGHIVDADDELLETLVKTATKTPAQRNGTRERKRTRHSDRKSLRRTLKNGLTEEERIHLASYIKSY